MEITVEWLFPDGEGGAKLPDGIVRVPGGIPGDRLRVQPVEKRGRTVIAAIDAMLSPSPHTRTPTCVWDATCGGCDLARLEPTARHNALAVVAQRAFRLPKPPLFVPSPRQIAHRARIKLAIDANRIGYRAARSHDLVEVGTCEVAREEVQAGLARLRAFASEHSLSGLSGVEIRSDGERAIYAFSSDRRVSDALREHLTALGDVAIDGQPMAGDPTLRLHVAGHALRCSPSAFYQVNLEINAALAAFVRQTITDLNTERLLELYAGIGNLSVPLAANGLPVIAVEREGAATDDLRTTLAEGSLPIRVVTGAAEAFDPSTEAFDVALLDPPRAGAPGVIPRILRNRPRGIVYVACHVPSAARDLKPALDAGYRLADVRCFDMFPGSHHFETVAVLVRGR